VTRRISLASGVLPEFDALTVAQTAQATGYTDAGLMVRPGEWQVADESELLEMKAAGLGYLDVEVLWIPQGAQLDKSHHLIVEVGRRLAADNLLVVSDEADADLLAPALAQISAWCDGIVRPCLEFLRITRVHSLRQAQELLAASDEHDFGILIDTLHLARSGEITSLPHLNLEQHPYIQLCDGLLSCVDEPSALLADALDGRSAAGEGELPLAGGLDLLPAQTPLSLEVRSKYYRDAYPQPLDRARAILEQTKTFLEQTI
jgi:sugar phosphate isomerase/epimerase